MPNLFIQIDVKFKLKDSEKNKALKTSYKPDDDYDLSITARSIANADINLKFDVGNDKSAGGTLTHELKDASLEVSCQGIFKINVKTPYVPDILDPKALWLFNSFGSFEQGLTGLEIQDGLREEEYEYLRRGETLKGIRYPLEVKTDKAKKNL